MTSLETHRIIDMSLLWSLRALEFLFYKHSAPIGATPGNYQKLLHAPDDRIWVEKIGSL